MAAYQKSHVVVLKEAAAKFSVRHGALTSGNDLYRAKMSEEEAQSYCGNNEACSGFTWQSKGHASVDGYKGAAGDGKQLPKEELPMVYFKSGLTQET